MTFDDHPLYHEISDDQLTRLTEGGEKSKWRDWGFGFLGYVLGAAEPCFDRWDKIVDKHEPTGGWDLFLLVSALAAFVLMIITFSVAYRASRKVARLADKLRNRPKREVKG